MRYGLLVVLAGVVGGCSIFTGPRSDWPPNVYQFAPPPSYAADWQQMEACAGITADFDRVTWFRSDSLLDVPGLGAFGISDWHHHRIALDAQSVNDDVVVRHEILHELLQEDGHPVEYFGIGGRCYAEVSH